MRTFDHWWMQTGSPQYLMSFLQKKNIPPIALVHRSVKGPLMSRFDLEDIEVDALLFQSGYLTIKEKINNDPI